MRSLTHWDRVTHICVSNLTTIGLDNDLSLGRCQAIRTNDGILLVRFSGTNFRENLIKIHILSSKKMHLKISSAKWREFCLGLKALARLVWAWNVLGKLSQCHTLGYVGTSFEGTTFHDQMETFSALLALCAGNSPVNGVTRSFDVFFDLRLNKRLSKQS